MGGKKPGRGDAGVSFEDAAKRVAAEIRRLDDVGDDIRRRVRDMRWTGRSAERFRRHADYQAVRAAHNRELLESLRVLLIQAAQAADSKVSVAS